MLFLHAFALLALATIALGAADFYKILGLDKSCDDRDLKRAYRTLSKKYHPDKRPTGDEKKFLEVTEAYEILSDQTTRRIYDQYGHDGIANHKRGGGGGGGGGGQHDPFQFFNQFFGGGGGGGGFGGGGQQVRRGPDMEAQLRMPLRDFYNGKELDFTIEKQQICDHCDGSGSEDGKVETCGTCNGRGMLVQKVMLAPGIFQQVQRHCDTCGGQGKTIKHRCQVCGGNKVVRKAVSLTASVEPGMPVNTRIVFEHEADEHPDHVAGNLNVVLVEQDPALGGEGDDERVRSDGTFFRRKDRDLYWIEVLSLREAWMGDWTRNLTHLDGHIVQLSRARGEVVQPGQVDTLAGQGMPIYHDIYAHDRDDHHDDDDSTDLYGKLYVEYRVILPDQMESSMEKDFWSVWEKYRRKNGIHLDVDGGRPPAAAKLAVKDEL